QLILQCYDSYYLSNCQKQESYFVVEMEYCYLPFVSFSRKCDICEDDILHLLSSFQKYLQDKYTIDEEILRYEGLELFVNVLEKNKICVKLNLLSLKSYVENQLLQEEKIQDEKKKKFMDYEDQIQEMNDFKSKNKRQKLKKNTSLEENSKNEDSKLSYAEQLENFLKYINNDIQKQFLVSEKNIQLMSSAQICDELLDLHKQVIQASLQKQCPHFQIQNFVDSKGVGELSYSSDIEDAIKEFTQRQSPLYLIVFDEIQQIKKMLAVYIQHHMDKNKLRQIKSAIKKLKKTDHLILQCYESFYLTDLSNIQSYFVVEMEFCDPLVKFIYYGDDEVKNLLSSFQNYLTDQHIFQIQTIDDEYTISDEIVELFVKNINQNQLCVKLNLLSLQSYLSKQLQQEDDNENQQKDHIQTNQSQDKEDIQNIKQEVQIEKINYQTSDESGYDSQKVSFFEENNNQQDLNLRIQDKLNNFLKYINKDIQKQDLVSEIKQQYSHLLQKYSLDLFENISQHPQYQSYQINAEIDGCLNLTITNKQDKKILVQVYQKKSFQDAQLFANQMQQLAITKQNLKFNILNIDVVPCEKEYYVLLEKSKINNRCSIEEMFSEQENCYNDDSQKKRLILLQQLIQLSQNLLIEYNIQITKVNPYYILIDREETDQNKISQYIIDQCVFFENFENSYQNQVEKAFNFLQYKFSSLKNSFIISEIASYNLIKDYFKAISQNSKEKVSQLYLTIQQCFKTLQLSFESKWSKYIYIINELQCEFNLILSDDKFMKNLTQIALAIQENNQLPSIQRIQIWNQEQEKDILKYITIHQTVYDASFLSLDNFKSVQQLNISSQYNFVQISQLNQFKNIRKIFFYDSNYVKQIKNISQFYKLKHLVQLSARY
ncbi:hypothetical protein ABPG74_002037, partial [Tetrahymena malaccensis]